MCIVHSLLDDLCGSLSAAGGGAPGGDQGAAPPTSSGSAEQPAGAETMRDRLSAVMLRLAAISGNVIQLETASRALEQSAGEAAGDEGIARLANHMISVRYQQNAKLQELTHAVSEKLVALKTRLRDVTVEVQKMRELAAKDGSQGNPIDRIVNFFSEFQREKEFQRFLPLATLYKANYTLFDLLQFDPSVKNMNELLTLDVSELKL